MSNKMRKILASLLALVIVAGCGFLASDARLRATDEEELPEVEAPAAEEQAAEQTEEPAEEKVEERVLVEENTEYTVSEVITVPSEDAEEEEFDVAAAYEYYMTLDEAGKEEYLASLSEENRETLLAYIKEMEKAEEEPEPEEAEEEPEPEEAEEEPEPEEAKEEPETEEAEEPKPEKKVNIWYSYKGKLYPGTKIVIRSEISGFENPVYQWQSSADGSSWENVSGANAASYTFALNEETTGLTWRLIVAESEPAAEEGE